MSKQKFTSADVRAMVKDGKDVLIGKRLANIYDLSERTYLFKFAGQSSGEKFMLLLESGIRFHLTKYVRNTPDLPSPFAMKLRRHIRTKRLEGIQQLGYDRVVDFRFGSGDSINHIILELYAGGNIVLTDQNYEVIALLRSHQFSEDVALKVGEIYPVAYSTNLTTAATIGDTSETTPESVIGGPCADIESFRTWIESKQTSTSTATTDNDEKAPKKKKANKAFNLKQILLHKDSGISHLGPEIIEDCLLRCHLKQNAKVDIIKQLTNDQLQDLLQSFHQGVVLLDQLQNIPSKGYILLEKKNESGNYVEYSPFLLLQHQEIPSQEFDTFSAAVDEYYYKIEDQRMIRELQSKEEAARKKIAKVQEDQENTLRQITAQRQQLEAGAMLLEIHASEVDQVRTVLNNWIENELSWKEIEDLVEETKAKGNPIAKLIARLKLDDKIVVLRFPKRELMNLYHNDSDSEDEEVDEEEEATKGLGEEDLEVEVNLTLTALANARQIHQNRKAAEVKEMKTIAANSKVLQTVQEQTMKNLEKQKISHTIKAARKVHWFEKFNWFITTEGFLVLSGKDAQQNELLFKRYLRPEDIYVHADIHGASSCIVRAKRKLPSNSASSDPSTMTIDVPNAIQYEDKYFVTPLAIQEAGIFAVCRSKAWSAKIITSSYWVRANQVSKTAPSGEYLTTGSLMIYGKKNYLPPMPLEMGFGILFRLEDNSVARHLNDRKIKSYEFDDESVVSFQDAVERYGIEGEQLPDLPETILEGEEEEEKEEDFREERKLNDEDLSLENLALAEDSRECEEEDEIDVVNNKEDNVAEEGDEEEEEENVQKVLVKPAGKKAASAPSESLKKEGNEAASKSKKKINKKKARRYAEQDEEDRELAMMVLGHTSSKGEKLTDKAKKVHQEKKKEDLKQRQLKAGINLLQNTEWSRLVEMQSPEVQEELQRLITDGLLREGDFNEEEMKQLSLFSPLDGLQVLNLYRDSKQVQKIVNKSSYLNGIMRRVAKDKMANQKKVAIKASQKEKEEIQALNQEEGFIEMEDEEDLKYSDDIDKLYPNPTTEDVILYAVPVCAPYLSMKDFKFRVKLTPGTVKKGKAAKQALDIFTKSKECSPSERNTMKNLNDNEVNAVMIGDVKLSMPGLFQQLKQAKQQRKGKK